MPKFVPTLVTPLNSFFTVTVARFPRNSEGRIRDFLLNQDNYTSRERPVLDHNRTVYVNMQMYLYAMLDLVILFQNERDEVITTASWMTLYRLCLIFFCSPLYNKQTWTDERMVWDPDDFEGLNVVILHVDEIWTPKIFHSNSLTKDSLEVISSERGSILLTSDGKVDLGVPVVQATQCPLNVRYFPFDTQICPLSFIPVNQYYQQMYLRAELSNDPSGFDSFEWNLLNTTISNQLVPTLSSSGEDEDVLFTVATFCLYLQRDPNYYITTIIIPSTLMCFMAFVTFLAPPDSGERISLGVSMVLGLTVFQLLIADTLPTSSKLTPILSTYLTTNFILACLAVPLSLVNINIAYKADKLKFLKYRWIRALLLECLPYFLCVPTYRESVRSEDDSFPVTPFPVLNDKMEVITAKDLARKVLKKNVVQPIESSILKDQCKSVEEVISDFQPPFLSFLVK
ncbi:Neuronal acetylcholine receptor subunit alpha-10 [Holothuria leucospilota]|uniref:Neuronal acetylcholine receptor subunit alpha-10 n=1 Tax=Holothuria leucospilota TaxID=206669 RepID=A0A9Q1BGA4_HOLLE|nr:Neuronal acetylcholine receptor subunit alpha-10 [Holothuria leucospilota]